VSNKSDKAKQADLKAQSDQLAREAAADRAAAAAPPALDAEGEHQAMDWFGFLKDPNHDFSKTPGMAFNQSGEEGLAGAEEERTALGSMQFGAAGADPNLQQVLKSNIQDRRIQRRGQSLERAVGNYDSMMRAMAGDISARDQARRMGNADRSTSAGANAMNNYTAFTPRPNWGLSLLASGIAGASQVGAAFAGK
jgi:hypothetical protein